MKKKIFKSTIYIIIIFGMILFCDIGYAKENKIALNDEKFDITNHTFEYPNLTVDSSITPYSITVSIEKGYFKINDTDITTYFDYKGGTNNLNAFVSTLKTNENYIAITFNLKSDADVNSVLVKDSVRDFLRNIKFYSNTNEDAKITMSVSEVKLEFTNAEKSLNNIGVIAYKDPSTSKVHYYAEIKGTDVEYMAAYKTAASSNFNGLQGYLLTITSEAEHNFVHNAYEKVHMYFGAAAISNYETAVYNSSNSEFTPASSIIGKGVSYKANPDNDVLIETYWRWISGPEAGQKILVDGKYNKFHSGEPNNTNNNEWCGMYGADDHGDWYDFPNTSYLIKGYYIEFGGFDNDNEIVKPVLVENTFKWSDYAYKFVSGNNQKLPVGTINKFTFTTNGDYSLFDSLEISDLDLIKDEDYTVTEGSTIITFTSKGIVKLNTLSKGEYDILVKYTNSEEATGKLIITELNPKTADNIILYSTFLCLSLIGIISCNLFLKRRIN